MSKIRPLIRLLQSFLTTWALMKASRFEPGNVLTIILFLFSFLFYRYVDEKLAKEDISNRRRQSVHALVIGCCFSLLYMAVDYPHYINTLTNPLFILGILCAVFLGFVSLFYALVTLGFLLLGNKERLNAILLSDACTVSASKTNAIRSFYRKHTPLCTFLLCMICWLPYFLYQYPGIMTPDSINQFEQVLGVIPYSNHHPWVHTLLMKLLYTLGFQITGSMLIGMSFYTFFQMCALSFSVSYLIGTLKLYRIKPWICMAITLFYALVPYHGVYSVTVWKDILFAAAVLIFSSSLLRLLCRRTAMELSLFLISGLMLCLFRSNGWYAFLLCLPFLLFHFRKSKRMMFPAVFGIFLGALIVKYPVMNAFQVTQPDLVESLSIPIQQVSAVLCNDRPLAPQELEQIQQVVDLTYIKELYDPYFADNIKELVRAGHQEYLVAHKGEFLKLWLTLGLRYPGDYLTAYIHQTYGYWYPDSFYLVAEAEGVSATSLGVSHTPLIRGPLVIKAKEIAIKLGGMLPLYGTLWSMGVIGWILIFCIGNTLVRREKKKLILYLPSIALLLTVLIATPVATEFRYVYFMVLSFPFYIMASILPLPEGTN